MPVYGNKSYKLKIISIVEQILLKHLKEIDDGNPKVKVHQIHAKKFLDEKSNSFIVNITCDESSLPELALVLGLSISVLNMVSTMNPVIGIGTLAGAATMYGIGTEQNYKRSQYNKDEMIKNQTKILKEINSQLHNYYIEFGELNVYKGSAVSQLEIIVHKK